MTVEAMSYIKKHHKYITNMILKLLIYLTFTEMFTELHNML